MSTISFIAGSSDPASWGFGASRTARGAGERERHQEAHQPEHGGLHRSEPFAHLVAMPCVAAPAHPPPHLEQNEHADEEPDSEQHARGDLAHGRSSSRTCTKRSSSTRYMSGATWIPG